MPNDENRISFLVGENGCGKNTSSRPLAVQQWRAFLDEPSRYFRHLFRSHDPAVDDDS